MAEDKIRKELIKGFNSDFPDSPLMEMEENPLAEIHGWITTGNYALNWIISKSIFKGLPLGRVVLFSGDAGSGKSMAALSMMREPSIDYIIYLDSEGGGVTTGFAQFLGIDTKKVLYSEVDTIEDLIARMGKIIDILEKNKTHKKVLMIVDSVSMLSTEREKDPSGGADMGNKAKTTRQFFRRYIRKMQKLNICTVFTAHLTQNIGGYGPPKVVSGGGTILNFAPSIEVRFTRVNAETELEQSAKGASMVKIRAEIIKSRLGTYGKRVKFDLDMVKGLDAYAGLFDIMKDYRFIIPAAKEFDEQIAEKKVPKKSSGWWCFKPFDTLITIAMHERIIKEGLTTSGKFRETVIKEWCSEHEWFLEEVQSILDSINVVDEAKEVLSEETETTIEKDETKIDPDMNISDIGFDIVEPVKMGEIETAAIKDSLEIEVKPSKTKKIKTPKVEITEVSN